MRTDALRVGLTCAIVALLFTLVPGRVGAG